MYFPELSRKAFSSGTADTGKVVVFFQKQWFSDPMEPQNGLEGLLKRGLLGFSGSGQSSRSGISHKLRDAEGIQGLHSEAYSAKKDTLDEILL